jgi:Flp pilus assembly protein TadG
MAFSSPFQLVGRFLKNKGGNFASILAIMAPILLGVAGGAFDLVVFNRQESKMQDAVDAAVLAATQEASLQNWVQEKTSAVADTYLKAALA